MIEIANAVMDRNGPVLELLISITDDFNRALILLALYTDAGRDRSGKPEALHPLRVSLSSGDTIGQTVGLLHDVLEDSDLEEEDLLTLGFSAKIVEAVALLTHRPKIDHLSYKEFIQRIVKSGNKLAVRVKLNDLADNLGRLKELSNDGEARGLRKRYRLAQVELEQVWDYEK